MTKIKNTKFIVLAAFVGLTVVSSVVTFAGKSQNFYKGSAVSSNGADVGVSRYLYSSVLSARQARPKVPAQNIVAGPASAFAIPVDAISVSNAPTSSAPIAISSPCGAQGKPVLRDGKVMGCSGNVNSALTALAVLGRPVTPTPMLAPSMPVPAPPVSTVAAVPGRPVTAAPAPVLVRVPTQSSAPVVRLKMPALSLTDTQTGSQEDSCEAQGKKTYTGPDKPGLLYGMCL